MFFDVIKLLYFLTPQLRSVSLSAAFNVKAAERRSRRWTACLPISLNFGQLFAAKAATLPDRGGERSVWPSGARLLSARSRATSPNGFIKGDLWEEAKRDRPCSCWSVDSGGGTHTTCTEADSHYTRFVFAVVFSQPLFNAPVYRHPEGTTQRRVLLAAVKEHFGPFQG